MKHQETQGQPEDSAAADIWTYSSFGASLKKNGRFFAIVTPDGKNALAPEAAIELIETLTLGSKKQQND